MATMLGSLLISLGLESGQFKSGLDASQKKFAASTKRMQRDAENAARDISNQMRTLAVSLGAYFSGRELVGLLDGFTRLRNNLRVAGVEGENLKGVQDRLFASAQRYGVSVEELSSLFGKASQSQRELNSTQEQLLTITNAAAAALKITGTNTQAASGALLGLTQAFSSGTVKAEEYNQMIEGGLQPLLQVVANSDKFGGSLGKLRNAVVDGKLSSKEFFDLLLKGARDLDATASKSVMTLTGGFTTLTNALTVYFGEADQANGVSAALGGTLAAVGKNLQTIIPIVATVGAVIASTFVANLIAAKVAAVALTVTTAGLSGGMATLGVVAGVTGRAILAAFGGPIGVAIAAIGASIWYLTTQTKEANAAAEAKRRTDIQAAAATTAYADATDKLAKASGRERDALIASMKASRARAAQSLQTAKALLAEARASVAVARTKAQEEVTKATRSTRGAGGGIDPAMTAIGRRDAKLAKAEASLAKAEASFAKAEGTFAGIDKAIKEAMAPVKLGATGDDSKGKKAKGAGGPSAGDIRARFNDELANYAMQAMQAEASIAKSATERADLEARMVELAKIRTIDAINREKDYSATQKQILIEQVNALSDLELQAIERAKQRQIEQEANDLAAERFRLDQEALQFQYDFADNQTDRARIAQEMLALEHRYQSSLLEAVIASETATEAEKKRAQIALDGLNAQLGNKSKAVGRANETPGQAYLREVNMSTAAINEAVEGIKVRGLENLNDGLADAIMGVKSLGQAFSDMAKQVIADLIKIAIRKAIIEPLAGALFGGGGFGIPGFANGTRFAPGGLAVVGERGPELVNLPRGSQVIPNKDVRGGSGINITVDARGANDPAAVRAQVQQGILEAAPAIIAAAEARTVQGMRRPRLGGAMQ
jgi:tape measure domain-containing protein